VVRRLARHPALTGDGQTIDAASTRTHASGDKPSGAGALMGGRHGGLRGVPRPSGGAVGPPPQRLAFKRHIERDWSPTDLWHTVLVMP